jgi:hypothetical protein
MKMLKVLNTGHFHYQRSYFMSDESCQYCKKYGTRIEFIYKQNGKYKDFRAICISCLFNRINKDVDTLTNSQVATLGPL